MRLFVTVLWILAVGVSEPSQASAQTGVASPNRRIVLTIDDLPAQLAPGLSRERLQAITGPLLSTLQNQQVPAVGFVNEEKLYPGGKLDSSRIAFLEQWLAAGFELGNHTFSHPDLHHTPLEEFQEDVLRGEKVSRPLAAVRHRPYRYFRHPFLHTGLDLENKIALEDFLEQHGYEVAPVTIDNSEWIFARAFDHALDQDDSNLQKRLGPEYVDYMLSMTAYYEDQSRSLFDREIPQILLLHANDLNARYLGSLLAALAQRGYSFIDLETALEDPAYSSPDAYVGPGGITWLHRWALTRGVDRSFFAGEPTTPLWVQQLAGIEE